jgi:hypothetical protein
MKNVLRPILAVVILVLVGVAGAIYWNSIKPTQKPTGIVDGGEGFGGLRIENSTGGDWLISIASGYVLSLKSVRMMIINSSTGEKTVDKPISALLPANNDPDAVFNDSSGNNHIDSGDTILLKGSSPNIKSGYKVQFLKGESIIGTIQEIP